jgi:hypothetical protein
MKYIITEQQLNDIPEEEPSKGKTVRRLVQDIGLTEVSEIMGGIDRVIELGYNGDLIKFSEETTTPIAYMSTDGMNLYLHEALVNELGLENVNFSPSTFSRPKTLGKFVYGSKNDIPYAFTANLEPIRLHNQKYYRVVGSSGDSGFGYGYITKRNTLGKRYRQQIFKQIIDKYDLLKYMTVKTFY